MPVDGGATGQANSHQYGIQIRCGINYKTPGLLKPGESITCLACQRSDNSFSIPFFAGENTALLGRQRCNFNISLT